MQAIINQNKKLLTNQLKNSRNLLGQQQLNVALSSSLYNKKYYSNYNNKQYQQKTNQLSYVLLVGGAVSFGLLMSEQQKKRYSQAEEQELHNQQKDVTNVIDENVKEQAENFTKSDDIGKSINQEDQAQQIITASIQEENQQQESIMKELTTENIKEVMNSSENKFIYFYKSSQFSQEEFNQVEDHATKIYNGFRVQPYKLDLDQHFADFSNFLKERNPAAVDLVDKQLSDNKFLLANKYDDIWFWEFDLIKFFYGELLEQIFNFYAGPEKLFTEEQIIMNQSTENKFHIVVYIDSFNSKESIKKIKNYRKYHTKNTDKFFNLKYWVTEDKEIAKKFKIDTSLENEGDIYLIRKSSIFNNKQKNINICGYDFHSEKILTSEEIAKDIQNSYAKILQFAFNNPILVQDYMTFSTLQHKFKTNMFVVYCPDKEINPKQYDEILRTMIKARKHMPINLKPDENGQLQKTQRQQDVVFVLSTTKNLMPITKLHIDKPQGLFITPEDNFVDLFNVYLPQLEKVEGLSPQEYLKKSFNNEQEFQYGANDNDTQRNQKDTMKLIFSPDRFVMGKMYQTLDMNDLTNYEKMVDFVKASVNGELKYYWDTEEVPKTKYAQKIVGEDFDKRILHSPRDAIVFVYHPIREKNNELMEKYEEFVKHQQAVNGLSSDGQLVYAKYNGINESQEYRSPQKLPQILYFKRVPNQEEKEIIQLDNIEDFMVKSAKQQDFEKKLEVFIQRNKKL